jgi:hypothetical protein
MTQSRSSPSFTNVECGFGHREQMYEMKFVIKLFSVIFLYY